MRPEFRALPALLRALPGRPGGAAGTPRAHCACAAVLSAASGLPRSTQVAGREHRTQRACVDPPPDPPAHGPGNPHPPQCALGAGRGNRLKPEWGSPRRWRGKEQEQGLPELPAPAFAVALATRRAGRSEGAAAAAGSGKPGGIAPA